MWQLAFSFASVGGTSSAGFPSKKPHGFSKNPRRATGITGQSSGRGTWWWFIVYQTTTSVSSIERSAWYQPRQPVAALVLVGELAGRDSAHRRVWGDPEVMVDERGARCAEESGQRERLRVLARDQPVADGLPDRVRPSGLTTIHPRAVESRSMSRRASRSVFRVRETVFQAFPCGLSGPAGRPRCGPR